MLILCTAPNDRLRKEVGGRCWKYSNPAQAGQGLTLLAEVGGRDSVTHSQGREGTNWSLAHY